MKKNDFRFCKLGFMLLEEHEEEFKYLHRATTNSYTEFDFEIDVCDGEAVIIIKEKNWCIGKREFYETNEICCPRTFNSIEEIIRFINYFLGRI
jgi:hypothetical protein